MSLSRSTHASIRRLAYFTTALTLALAGVAVPAQAGAPDKAARASLPATGEQFNLDASSDGIDFTVDGEALTSAPLRGTLAVTIEANPSDPKRLSVEAKPSDLRLSTKAAQTHSITVDQGDAVDEKSLLRLVKPKAAKYKHVMALNLAFTITMPTPAAAPTPAEAEQTLQLTTAKPVLLGSSLKSFPPDNALYSLAKPVRLVSAEGVVAPAVKLKGFDVIVNKS